MVDKEFTDKLAAVCGLPPDALKMTREEIIRASSEAHARHIERLRGSSRELCYGKTEIDWETEERHSYVRAFWCPECQAAKYDGEDFPTPHFKGTTDGPIAEMD